MDILIPGYVLESPHMKKFFTYPQNPNFDIASDVQATFKFFPEYNSRLLESPSYITKRHAVKLLGDILLDRSNSATMVKYVSSMDNMRIMMNLLRLFVANQNKPPEIAGVLVTNRSKLLRFSGNFNIDKVNEQFEADKSLIMREIATSELTDSPCGDLDDCVDFHIHIYFVHYCITLQCI